MADADTSATDGINLLPTRDASATLRDFDMAIEITIPRLGWSMDEGTFGEWLKHDGDLVAAGDPLFSLESEKALQEVESVDAGVLHILPGGPREGDTVKVGARIGWLLAEGESPPVALASGEDTAAARASLTNQGAPEISTAAPPKGALDAGGRQVRISPRAARIAAELGIDPRRIAGTGRDGRIREADIRGASASTPGSGPRSPSLPAGISTIRRTIAERMLHSHLQTAPVTLTTRADAEPLVTVRRRWHTERGEPVPSYQDWIIQAVAATLRENTVLNQRWTDAGPASTDGIHIGLAVDTPEGLLVPVVRDADRLCLEELAVTTRRQIERARGRACTSDELRDATITVTNLGGFGIDAFTPIINLPETAVLGIGAIRREAAVLDDGSITARHQMTLSLTFDHRVTDGAPAARWLQALVRRIESLTHSS